MDLRSPPRVGVVDGGIMGIGTAHHLTHDGWGPGYGAAGDGGVDQRIAPARDRADHAIDVVEIAGVLHRLRNRPLFGRVGDRDGPGRDPASLRIVQAGLSRNEMDWLRHRILVTRALGFRAMSVGPERVAQVRPFYNLDGVLGALHLSDDAHVGPTNVTMAMAAGGRDILGACTDTT